MRVVPFGTEVRQDGMLPADEKPGLRCIIASAAALRSDLHIIFLCGSRTLTLREAFFGNIYCDPDYINR